MSSMDFAPLTPPPTGNKPSPEMTLLTSTPNSYSPRKPMHQYHVDTSSNSRGLFGPTNRKDSETKPMGLFNNHPSPPGSEEGSSADTMDSDSSSSLSEDKNEDQKLDTADLSDDDEPVDCANCNEGFTSLQSYMDHKCPAKTSEADPGVHGIKSSANHEGDLSDGESFNGKIVYNSDGSAYIIDGGDSDLSDLESVIDLPDQDKIIVDKKGSNVVSQVPSLPQIANAFFVSRNPNFNGTYSIPTSQFPHPQAPMMFSYRVYDVRTGKSHTGGEGRDVTTSEHGSYNVPTKPILMCFICKLSFGVTKSFTAHAASEHSMCLNEEERRIMSRKNASAIIQCVGTEKEPLMSFLEPKPLSSSSNPSSIKSSNVPSIHMPNSDMHSVHRSAEESTSVSNVHSKPKTSSPYKPLDSGKRNVDNDNRKSDSPYCNDQSGQHGANTLKVSDKSNDSYTDDPNESYTDMESNSSFDTSGTKASKSTSSSAYLYNKMSRNDTNTPSTTSSASHATVPSSSMPLPPSSPHGSLMPPSSPHNSMMFLGMCDEHPQGRIQGVECPKCDMVLGSSQSLGGHMTMMHSRNSCKTLKCPKCNWHYKYQETLEIHMKEKHPESDQQCVYCISNQPHPRLARGESYSCGYKPYRCEVCNYSTTTKGNLSIHMQSDKHLNNVQELANGSSEMKMPPQQAPPPPTPTQPSQAISEAVSQMKNKKPKPTWRCDVCNYETNVARNLRIHMTSEKHTHNMMVLQQNMKHMQRDMQIQQMNQLMLLQNDPSYLAGIGSPITNSRSFPYDQSMLLAGLQAGYGDVPVDLRKENGGMGLTFDPQMPDASQMFQCCVCNLHSTDSLESLHNHLQMDRTKLREQENIQVSQGTYMCNLCQYKTQLKANFQLHCKTDKHLQRLQLVNHIKEGGPSNEWRLKYLNVSNPVQVRCNSCDYYTNSIHKLQIHTGNPRHESNAQLFVHLQRGEKELNPASRKYYYCSLCKFSTRAKLNLIQHVRSMKHMHSEGLKQQQMKEQNITEIDPSEIFQVRRYTEEEEASIKFDEEDCEADEDIVTENEIKEKPKDVSNLYNNSKSNSNKGDNLNNNSISNSTLNATGNSEEQIHVCPYCDYSSVCEMRIQAHIVSQHTQHCSILVCPLCHEEYKDQARLERHLTATHSVKGDALQRLMLMLDRGDWMAASANNTQTPTTPPIIPLDESGEINTEALEAEAAKLAAEAIDTAALPEKGDADDQYRCQTCSKTFSNIDGLYAHQNELGHLELKQTPRGPGYLCWKKGCNQYFKTAQALQVHFREIHAKRSVPSELERHIYKYKCTQCSLAFKTSEKLQLHSHYHLIRSATKCSFCARSFRSVMALKKHIETGHSDVGDSEKEQYLNSLNASSAVLATILANSQSEKAISTPSSSVISQTSTVNSITSPLVCATMTEKSNDAMKTDLNSNETPEKCESMDAESSEGSEKSSLNEGMEGVDPTYREQQFLEDYMNSQAMAEGSYEDPNRKFKCHRCKVAFTKQGYLTAHNKTLLHRKGDKMSYPMEKYLDPNRPFKCEICKESFTQKNILLVHYNSVSHLHKVKQASQTGSLPVSMETSSSSPVQQESSVPPSSTETSTLSSPSSTTSSTANSEVEKSKPYKCNICKVSYSQGSTLDIHIRSVGHQTRASKLHELFLLGQVDLSQPLIEQPNDSSKSQQQQQQKLLAEMLQFQPQQFLAAVSQPSLLFPGLPGLTSIPMLPGLPIMTSPDSLATGAPDAISYLKSQIQAENKQSSKREGGKPTVTDESSKKTADDLTPSKVSSPSTTVQPTYLCQKCNAVFTNQDSLTQHQLMCLFQTGSPLTIQQQLAQSKLRPTSFVGRKPQIQKNLLENIGFECVMQFNEFNQPSNVKEEKSDAEGDGNDGEDDDEKKEEEDKEIKEEKEEVKKEEEEDDPVKAEPEDHETTDLPELNKCVCNTCSKEFSSVWVLKAHQEEVHKDIVPTDLVADFGEKFKSDYEKKQPKESEQSSTGQLENSASLVNGQGNDGEGSCNQEMPPPPPPPPQISPQMDLSQIMPMFGLGMPMPMPFNMSMAMNMQPSLMPMMFPLPSDTSVATSPITQTDSTLTLQKQQAAQLAAQQAAMNQKRARTRINDEQLKILRAHFDINNSPSEEQIMAMSEQSGLPTKVIKHWFRNTLFKERQRNKDSPYNFSVAPTTTLDLEEYEKTGKIPVVEENAAQEGKEIKKEPVEHDEEAKDTKFLDEREQLQQQLEQQQQIQMARELQQQQQQQMPKEQPAALITPKEKYADAPKTEPRSAGSPDLSDSHDSFSNMSASSSLMSTPSMSSFGLLSPHMGGQDIRQRFEPSMYHSGYNKRANRTRFTDYQIKVLQEYFEQNAYPKDDELDHLSQVLNLSPRVIVVWFQNARQKARKIYENQPAEPKMNESPFQRTAGLNYQCKKCSAVFQRYYDLIRHQKKQCGLDGDRIQMPLHGGLDEESDSLSTMSHEDNVEETGSTHSHDLSTSGEKETKDHIKFKCEKCHLSFDRLDLWREHQNVHSMNPSLFQNLSSSSAFGVLQSMAAAQQQESKGLVKRKLEEEKDMDGDDQPRDKRLRTTILPEQLDYLYQKYQIDCNPSRKQLENISAEVGLKKRVVQVWFQNTRARERKGQYRAHQQLIHKRCPFCRALFRAKSALESHLATKHPEEMAKGDINVDALPDAAIESPSNSQGMHGSMMSPAAGDFNKMFSSPSMQSFMPPGFPMGGFQEHLQMSMKQMYEDSYKRLMTDLGATPHKDMMKREPETPPASKHIAHSLKSSASADYGGEAPLDLSKPLKVNTDHDKSYEGPSTDRSDRGFDDHNISMMSNKSLNDSFSETHSNHENDDSLSISTSRPSSPSSNMHGGNMPANKRYRTQMTSLQVRIMKSIFSEYKTPTMAECEMLGREIGLPKRVVQVWFQNARAKEKKAKLNMHKNFEIEFPKPPEECSLCRFKYSHKYTIQDHIFTKKHIDKVRMYIQSQSDVERDLTPQSASTSEAGRHHDVERMRKAFDDAAMMASSQSHLAQLQAMGLHSLLPPTALSGGSFNTSDILKESKKEKSETDSNKKSEASKKESDVASQMASHMMNPFGGFLPGLDPAMMSYMGFGGIPGFLPGMGLPFGLPPGFMPGAEQLMQYDPMTFGTPLQLLQIPAQAIKDVSVKLSEPHATVAQYTQDCKSISSLRSLVNTVDYSCAREATVDVGYICKKCQTVYPAKEACMGHQRTMCFPDGKVPENISPIMKLEQIQYECRLCVDKFSTVQEFKSHCQSESHGNKVRRLQQKSTQSSPSKGSNSSTPQGDKPVCSSPNKSSSMLTSPMPKSNIKSVDDGTA